MLEQWVVLPVSMFFGALSMFFGIGVAPMFLPYLVLVQNLPFGAAIAATLIIEIFGFSAGLISFIRRGSIAYSMGLQIVMHTVPAAIIGVLISLNIPSHISLLLFSLVLLVTAVMIFHPEHEILYRRDDPATGYVVSEFGIARNISLIASTLSGLLAGVSGTGVGETNNYVFLKKFRMPGEMATATSMFVIAITAFVAAGAHSLHLFIFEPEVFLHLTHIIAFGIVGIILGVLVGSSFKLSLPDRTRERYVATLFLALGILALVTLTI